MRDETYYVISDLARVIYSCKRELAPNKPFKIVNWRDGLDEKINAGDKYLANDQNDLIKRLLVVAKAILGKVDGNDIDVDDNEMEDVLKLSEEYSADVREQEKQEFLSLVSNKYTDYSIDVKHCPYCESEDIEEYEHTQTLVGSVGSEDPNHHWVTSRCNSCGKKFTKEFKKGNVWFTDQNKNALEGISNCFEYYNYDCAKCGGEHTVSRTYRKMDGVSSHEGGLSYRDGKAMQRCFFVCSKCNAEVEQYG